MMGQGQPVPALNVGAPGIGAEGPIPIPPVPAPPIDDEAAGAPMNVVSTPAGPNGVGSAPMDMAVGSQPPLFQQPMMGLPGPLPLPPLQSGYQGDDGYPRLSEEQILFLQQQFGRTWPDKMMAIMRIALPERRTGSSVVGTSEEEHHGGDSLNRAAAARMDVIEVDTPRAPMDNTTSRTTLSSTTTTPTSATTAAASIPTLRTRTPWPLPSEVIQNGEVDSDAEWDSFPEREESIEKLVKMDKNVDKIPESVQTLMWIPTPEKYRTWKKALLNYCKFMHYDRPHVFAVVTRVIAGEMRAFFDKSLAHIQRSGWDDTDARLVLHRMAQLSGVSLTHNGALQAVKDIKISLGQDNVWQVATRLEDLMKTANMNWTETAVKAELVAHLPNTVRDQLRADGWLDTRRSLEELCTEIHHRFPWQRRGRQGYGDGAAAAAATSTSGNQAEHN